MNLAQHAAHLARLDVGVRDADRDVARAIEVRDALRNERESVVRGFQEHLYNLVAMERARLCPVVEPTHVPSVAGEATRPTHIRMIWRDDTPYLPRGHVFLVEEWTTNGWPRVVDLDGDRLVLPATIYEPAEPPAPEPVP